MTTVPCRPILEISKEPIPNAFDPSTIDEIIRVACRGIATRVYVANTFVPARKLPLEVRVTSRHPLLSGKFQIGSSMAAVRLALGSPLHEEKHALTYMLPAKWGVDSIKFIFLGNALSEIVWLWGID